MSLEAVAFAVFVAAVLAPLLLSWWKSRKR